MAGRASVSVRTRITATVALLLLAGLVLAGAVVWSIESARLDRQLASDTAREFAQLRKLQRGGVDPATGEPFPDTGSMVRVYLQRTVPDDDELLVGWWDGAARVQSPAWDEISASPELAAAVVRLLPVNGTDRVGSPAGELEVSVQGVQQGRSVGALVVVRFLDRARAGLHETMRTYAIVAALTLLVVTAVAAWVSGRLLSPLRTLRQTTDEISATDLSRRLPETGNDDITALTRTVNGMLGRLEGAFVGQRQFLDDASHELRTPLTVLRGHLELLDPEDSEEVAATRELLLDETDRMGRLVGDLVVLAKSDRPDFLHLREVDLEALTRDVLAKARGLGDRTWELDAVAEHKILADEQRLTQALLQLADNAVKHTRPGDLVAIGSSYAGGTVRLWVRDSGPGVPPEDRARIFERFGRSAVPPGDEGFGLGLSIVGAIARAHSGGVSVEDAEPTGARFVISIPEEDTWPAS
ncbi:sensor histidine kinase [Nocardioides sp.]|uniref:sensor histidine kinase n=1 Tax=Nocardioides sp. TaxID=35761 RepID=UPI0037831569